MEANVAQKTFNRTGKEFLDKVFAGAGKVHRKAAEVVFMGIAASGSTLVSDIAKVALARKDVSQNPKELQERISGWLEKHDFSQAVEAQMRASALPLVGRDTAIPVDMTDLSKAFGKGGMEGMQPGWDASLKRVSYGHEVLTAAVAPKGCDKAWPLRVKVHPGRKGAIARIPEFCRDVLQTTGGKGIPVIDRGGDGVRTISGLLLANIRSVVRIADLRRDVFGDGRPIDEAMAELVASRVTLSGRGKSIQAEVRWKTGCFPVEREAEGCGHAGKGPGRTDGPEYVPVLCVSSTIGGRTLYLYMLTGGSLPEDARGLRELAELAAQVYYDRWSVEILFEDLKQSFGAEGMRVRSLKRLTNLLFMSVLAYIYSLGKLCGDSETRRTIIKLFRDNAAQVHGGFRSFVATFRLLLAKCMVRYISGRPKKRAWTDPRQLHLGLD